MEINKIIYIYWGLGRYWNIFIGTYSIVIADPESRPCSIYSQYLLQKNGLPSASLIKCKIFLVRSEMVSRTVLWGERWGEMLSKIFVNPSQSRKVWLCGRAANGAIVGRVEGGPEGAAVYLGWIGYQISPGWSPINVRGRWERREGQHSAWFKHPLQRFIPGQASSNEGSILAS